MGSHQMGQRNCSRLPPRKKPPNDCRRSGKRELRVISRRGQPDHALPGGIDHHHPSSWMDGRPWPWWASEGHRCGQNRKGKNLICFSTQALREGPDVGAHRAAPRCPMPMTAMAPAMRCRWRLLAQEERKRTSAEIQGGEGKLQSFCSTALPQACSWQNNHDFAKCNLRLRFFRAML